MRRLPVMSALTLALTLPVVSHADVWKWVDSKGQAQYSDRWVPGAELIKSDHAHPASTPADDTKKAAGPTRAEEQLAQQAQAQAVQKDVANARAEQCKQAKDRYDKAIQARRIYKTGKDGEREYLTDEEADQERMQARQEMDQACGNSASSSGS
jgi:hypothetical protein